MKVSPMSYTWRPVAATDLDALAALDRAWLAADGPISVPEPPYRDLLAAPEAALLCAAMAESAAPIVAVGWVQGHGAQARLGGKVHPAQRRQGLGTHLLRWAEGQARARGAPSTLVIRNEALHDDSAALYARAGYALDFAEDWLERDMRAPLPAIPQAVRHVPWTAETAPRFFAAYGAAFSTRPNFRPGPAADWIAAYTEDADFRADLSLLALAGDAPVGFVTAGVLPVPGMERVVGWVSQVGADPAWRGRRVGAGLVVAVLAAFAREGCPAVGLHVNVNNPAAARVYARLGFRFVNRRARYAKGVES